MSTMKRILKNSVMSCSLLIMMLAVLASPVYAASSSTQSGILNGTSDYLETDTWIESQGLTGLNFQSSSWLKGGNPTTATMIQDSNVITVNGVAVTLGNTGGSASTTSNSATYQCTFYDNSYCGTEGSNLSVSWWSLSVTTNDTTTVQVYSTAQKYVNGASATIIW